jgi:HemY protein
MRLYDGLKKLLRWCWRLLLLALLVLLALGFWWLAAEPGTIDIRWHGWQVETSAIIGVVLLLLLMNLAIFLDRLGRWLWQWPLRRRRRRHTRRLERGLNALSEGMLAMASGDTRQAQKLADRASRLVKREPIAMLLSAQSAELAGDSTTAASLYTKMLDVPETRIPALRGLLQQAEKNSNPTVGLAIARQAYGLEPEVAWVRQSLVVWLGLNQKWQDAEEILDKIQKDKQLPKPALARWRAVILLQRAQILDTTTDDDQPNPNAAAEKTRLVAAAFRLAPDYRPVALAELARLVQDGQGRTARALLQKWWEIAPSKELLELHTALNAKADVFAQLRAAETLANRQPQNPFSLLLIAEAALACKLWGKARQALQSVIDQHPVPEAFRLMAVLEKSEHGSKEAAYKWLDKAAKTPESASWTCNACAATQQQWAPICPSCHAMASLDFTGS